MTTYLPTYPLTKFHIVGLERTFRLFQALTQVLSSYTLAFDLLFRAVLTLSADREKPPLSPEALGAVLVGVGQRLALVRRFLRLFRFLESFSGAQKLYLEGSSSSSSASPSSSATQQSGEKQQQQQSGAKKPKSGPGLDAEDWLDVFGRTFNGMYLLLESSVLADVAGIEGLAVWGPDATPRVALEAQRFWLLALVCGVGAGLLRIVRVFAYAAVSQAVRGDQTQSQGGGEKDWKEGEWDLKSEQKRLRDAVGDKHGARGGGERGRGAVDARVRRLARGVVANALDIALPGTAVGLLDLAPGTVGLAMFATSVLTGMDVWEKCGSV